MPDWHALFDIPGLVVDGSAQQLRLRVPDGPEATFTLVRENALSSRRAEEIIAYASNDLAPPLLVAFSRSTSEARAALRGAGISFVGDDGHVFLRTPALYVERDVRPRHGRPSTGTPESEADFGSGTRNPFAVKSSRVPRLLLRYPDRVFTPSSIAREVGLNPAAVSRIFTALEDDGFVRQAATEQGPGRKRTIQLQRGLALLEEWLVTWRRRRVQHWRWDIGSRTPDEALGLLRDIGERRGWALGGLAGAAQLFPRVVEPATVSIWIGAEAVDLLSNALSPDESRGGRGTLEVALAPDDWIFELASEVAELPVADPVQLWLDCSSEGERALEAADSVAQLMSWS